MRSSAVAGLYARPPRRRRNHGQGDRRYLDVARRLRRRAGPDLEDPLGRGGEGLHEWAFAPRAGARPTAWRAARRNADSEVDRGERGRDRARSSWAGACSAAAAARGSRTPGRDGWWGDEPPFHAPVFVLTHHAREPLPMEGGTTFNFVTDGIESAIEQARAAAGEKDVLVAGGAHGRPAGARGRAGRRAAGPRRARVPRRRRAPVRRDGGRTSGSRSTRVVDSPGVTHLRYRVVRS